MHRVPTFLVLHGGEPLENPSTPSGVLKRVRASSDSFLTHDGAARKPLNTLRGIETFAGAGVGAVWRSHPTIENPSTPSGVLKLEEGVDIVLAHGIARKPLNTLRGIETRDSAAFQPVPVFSKTPQHPPGY